MAALDLTQPYGQVFNDGDGRYFEQAGQFFTASGEAWTAPVDPAAGSAKKKPASQVDAQLADPAAAPQEQP